MTQTYDYERVCRDFQPPTCGSYFSFAVDTLDHHAMRYPNAPAIWVSSLELQQYQISYGQLKERSQRAARAFWNAGVRKGDKVIMVMDRRVEWAEVALGLMRIGAIISPGVSLLMPKEYEYRFNTITAKYFFGDLAAYRRLKDVAYRCPSLDTCFLLDEVAREHLVSTLRVVHYKDLLARTPQGGAYEAYRGRSDATAAIYFTSGTTGNPKPVAHAASFPLLVGTAAKYWAGMGPNVLSWSPSDQGWIAYFYTVFGCLSQRGCFLVQTLPPGGVDPKFMLQVLHKLPINHLGGAASLYKLYTQSAILEYIKRYPPRALKTCTTGGEALPLAASQLWQAATGLLIHEGYGQTESAMLLCNFSQLKGGVRQGSMGRPVPGIVLACIDGRGHAVPTNTEGEIAVRVDDNPGAGLGSRAIFKGYIKADGSFDRRTRSEEGSEREWYLTGDRGRVDEDGFFWYIARGDDVISSSGYRIGPFEVEDALQSHPSVRVSAVVGSPDRMRGQLVKAFVVLEKAYEDHDPAALIKQLQDHVKATAAPYKYPREIEFVSELPLTSTGKIKRAELRILEEMRKAQSKL